MNLALLRHTWRTNRVRLLVVCAAALLWGTLVLVSVFAVGFASGAVAGERERGTLEVLLSRPLSRRRVYATLLFAALGFVALVLTALLLGALVSASVVGAISEIELGRVPLAWHRRRTP